MDDIIQRAATLPNAIGGALSGFGGFLRCESCGRRQDNINHGQYIRDGWPKCCGYTMRWWTQSQIDAGEVPEITSQ